MFGPIFEYMMYAFYINDGFQKVKEKPDARVCRFFSNDCSRFLNFWEEELSEEKKGKLVCIKLLSNIFENYLENEDYKILHEEKKLWLDFDDLFQKLITFKFNLLIKEQEYFIQFLETLYDKDKVVIERSDRFYHTILSKITDNKMQVQEGELIIFN